MSPPVSQNILETPQTFWLSQSRDTSLLLLPPALVRASPRTDLFHPCTWLAVEESPRRLGEDVVKGVWPRGDGTGQEEARLPQSPRSRPASFCPPGVPLLSPLTAAPQTRGLQEL